MLANNFPRPPKYNSRDRNIIARYDRRTNRNDKYLRLGMDDCGLRNCPVLWFLTLSITCNNQVFNW